ncbi:calcium-binding protein [Ferrovibrio terrae]|uniref:calcium-binding protein n=1 Tax=Ferrovibrio terrae TaxID=2594003 RepID=UPI003138163E
MTVDLAAQAATGGDAAGDTLSGFEGVIGSSYNDTLTGSAAVDYLDGGAGDDMLFGGASADVLTGGDGNDTMDGGTGSDSMYGGAGNDIYYIESGDGISEAANAGIDTAISSVSFTLGANVENLTLTGTVALNGVGNDLGNTIIGNSGVNALTGNSGADILHGAAGDDNLQGGLDNDVYRFNRGDGFDTVFDDYTYRQEYLEYNEWGEAGLAYRDVQLNAGQDTLEFGAGITAADLLFETSGNDLIVGLQNAGGTLTAASQAADRVLLQNWYNVNDKIENIRFADGSTLSLQIGTSGNDALAGTTGIDLIIGQAGTDTVSYAGSAASVSVSLVTGAGTGGNAQGDILIGIENLTGSNNADTLIGDAVANVLNGGYGYDVLQGGAGNDTLNGGADSDNLNGGDGIDILNGDDGDDWLAGGAGADQLSGGAGIDTVYYSGAGAAVTVSLDTGTGTTGDAAGDTLTGIENLVGSDYDDIFTGSNGANSISGGVGNDTLHGYAGDDTLQGGTGIDVMNGGAGNDIYVMSRGDGIDSVVQSGISDAAMTTDILRFAGGVSYDQLWFRQDGNDLVINVIGETESQVSLKDWYIDASSRVDSIQTVDGNHAISAANIQSLVDAMAAYTAPPVGQMVLDAQVANDLAPIFATTWA